jgi:hypothetical protein
MNIELDWQIDAEQTRQVENEDPQRRRQRRYLRRRLLLSVVLVALLVCGVAVVGILRWQAIQQSQDNALKAAVNAELNAIRIGRAESFRQMQRSDSTAWLQNQQALYEEYQLLKQQGRYSPTTQILEVEIDENRGRALIQETIDGQAYQQVWFYWNFAAIDPEDTQAGWRHLPPDVTFWGEDETLEGQGVTIRYQALDAATAEWLLPKLETWWGGACVWLNCQTPLPPLEVRIDPAAAASVAWTGEGQLSLVSPFMLGRVAIPPSLNGPQNRELGLRLAERALSHASGGRLLYDPGQTLLDYDTTWLKHEAREWLMSLWTGETPNFWASLSGTFGPGAVAQVLQTLEPGGQINALAPALGAANLSELPTPQLEALAWADFFQWRLELEQYRLQTDLNSFYALYENGANNPAAAAQTVNLGAGLPLVQGVSFSYRSNGQLVALVTVLAADATTQQFQYVWVGDTFLRAN